MKNINEVKFIDYPNSPNNKGYTAYPSDFNYVADLGMTGTIAEQVKKMIEHLDELFLPENSDKADIMEKTAPFRKRPDYPKAQHKYNQIRTGYIGGYGGYGSYGSRDNDEGSEASEGAEDEAGGIEEVYKALKEFYETYRIKEDFSGTTADISIGGGTIAGSPAKGKKGENAYFTTGYTRLHEDEGSYDYATAEREYHDMNALGQDAAAIETRKEKIKFKIEKAIRLLKQYETRNAMAKNDLERDFTVNKIVEIQHVIEHLAQELQKFTDITENHIPMTEKEKRIKAIVESYGVVKKSSKPIEEKDEEEDDSEDDSKGPKKGVNPFAKKKDKEDSEDDEKDEPEKKKKHKAKKGENPFKKKDDEEGDSEDEFADDADGTEEKHIFKGAGSEVCVYGVGRDEARSLAAKLLAPIEGVGPVPVGKYEIKFEVPEEEELEKEIDDEEEDMI